MSTGRKFENIKASIVNDRYASFEDFLNNFCNTDRAWQASFIVASGASPYATYGRVDTWLTGFRANLAKVDVPTLVMRLPVRPTVAIRLRRWREKAGELLAGEGARWCCPPTRRRMVLSGDRWAFLRRGPSSVLREAPSCLRGPAR